MAPSKINIKERVTDGEIDLSMSDLQDVPVKDIAVFKKAGNLDLSNNHLKTLPGTFATLTHLTKLDLSKNQLSELPDNFGDLVKLKYLDLYHNNLQHLPVSFHKLKALKWLDLKDNPLVPVVAKVAGPCSNAKECHTCAINVVNFFSQVQEQVENDLKIKEKHRQRQLEINQQKIMENKKNKKKEKAKQKKENGPSKENTNIPKPQNKKNKKLAAADKPSNKSTSCCKILFLLISCFLVSLFILTSVKYEHTRVVEDKFVHLYAEGVNALPPNLQVYAATVGGYINYVHNRTGNFTLETVKYVQNTDWEHVYSTVSHQVTSTVEKIKEQVKQYVS